MCTTHREPTHATRKVLRCATCATTARSTSSSIVSGDPDRDPPVRPSDPDDEYLVSLAAASRAVIVTGDRALLGLAGRIPVYSPSDFVALIQSGRL